MELWRTEVIEGRRPQALSTVTVIVALALHLAVFAVFGLFARFTDKKRPETIIPIDLTVVVNENLDGVENEPPPLKNPPPPEPPKPKPKPRPKPAEKKLDPPKPLEQIVTNVVKKAEKRKPDPPKREPERKKPEPKRPEPPKKTAKELREERMKRIRARMKTVNKPVTIEVKNAKASGNGRTARQTMSRAEIERLLRQGYRPGSENRLAANEKQRCLSLIEMVLRDRWGALGAEKNARVGVIVSLSFQLNSAGGLVNVRLAKGCGDVRTDQTALAVARTVTSIPGLSADFIAEFSKNPIILNYKVGGD